MPVDERPVVDQLPRWRSLHALALALASVILLCSCGGTSARSSEALGSEGAATAAVTVSPLAGTPDASPRTQISFLGAAGTRVLKVSVSGSASGRHPGSVREYATGTGASFLPSRPFRAGERVTVHAEVQSAGRTQKVTSSFTIAHQASVSQREFPNNPGDPRAVQHYSSAPTLTPSTLRVTTAAKPSAAGGYLFLAPYQGVGTPGPMIADQQGRLVWFHPLPPHRIATNFQVQQYDGKPVLTWWQGHVLQVGFGQGEDVIFDSSYRQIARVRAGNGYLADLHEIRLTPQGTAWIDIFDPIHLNTSAVHGATNGIVTDSVIQQIDIKTGLVMWEWHALGHIALSDSYIPAQRSSYPWDYLHINSVDPGSAGDVLLSARNTCTLYDVDMHSGHFNWQLGARHSSFRLGPGTRFYFQHDAEFQPSGLISVFDNGSTPPKEKQSRGLLLRLNRSARTVTLAKALVNPSATLLAESQGNMQSLAGGNWLLGYGRLPNLTEFDSSGNVLLDATFGKNVQDFRSYLSQWSGQPTGAPALVARRSGSGVQLATSWNGATDVASWRVLAGASAQALTEVRTAAKTGFETTITLPGAAAYVEVQALDSAGALLASSAAVAVS